MKKPLPPFIKEMQVKATAKKGMHTMPDGKKMKDSAMKKPSAYAKGGFTKAADGVAQKGKTKAKRFDMGGGVMGATPVVPPVDPNTTVGPPPSRLYQSVPGGNPMVQRVNPVNPTNPMVPRGSPRMDRNNFRAARDADRDDKRDKPKRMMAPGMTGAPVKPKMGMGISPEQMAVIQARRAAAKALIGKLPAAPVTTSTAPAPASTDNTAAIRAMYSANPTATRYNPNGPDATAMKYWQNKINTSGLDAVQNGMFGQEVIDYAAANPMKKGGAVKPKAYASGGCVSSKPTKMARGGGCEVKGKTKGRYI